MNEVRPEKWGQNWDNMWGLVARVIADPLALTIHHKKDDGTDVMAEFWYLKLDPSPWLEAR